MSLVGANIKPEWELYHGSIGTVLDIVYKNTTGPHTKVNAADKLPEYVLVDFPQYCGPNMYKDDENIVVIEREKRKTWVPIPMMEGLCKLNGACKRYYMPLAVSFGKKIHSF